MNTHRDAFYTVFLYLSIKKIIQIYENEKYLISKELSDKEKIIEEKNEIISSLKKTLNSFNEIEEKKEDSNIIKLDLTNEKSINKELNLSMPRLKTTQLRLDDLKLSNLSKTPHQNLILLYFCFSCFRF